MKSRSKSPIQTLQSLVRDEKHWLRLAPRSVYGMMFLLLLLLLLPWVQTSQGNGRVIAFDIHERQQDLTSPIEGRLNRWLVSEGSVVKEGQPVLELADNDPEILNRLRSEMEAIKKRLEAAKITKENSKLNLTRQKELLRYGLSADRTVELSKIELARMESEEAAAQAELSRIQVRLSRQEQQNIVAPSDGTIVRILKTSSSGGIYVKSGEILAKFVPETKSRSVELFVHGNDIPWVRMGQEVRLQFQGWPAFQFSGWPDLALGTFSGTVSLIDAAGDHNGNFRIVVSKPENAYWPPPEQLKQGILTSGWIQLGTVGLGYEIWRQFNGFPPFSSGMLGEAEVKTQEKAQ